MMKYLVSLFELTFYKKIEDIYKDLSDDNECNSLPENKMHLEQSSTMEQVYYQKERTSQMPIKNCIDFEQTTHTESPCDFKKGESC
jgi:hypothetical protein